MVRHANTIQRHPRSAGSFLTSCVLPHVCFNKTFFHLCLLHENTLSCVCLSKTPSNTTDKFPLHFPILHRGSQGWSYARPWPFDHLHSPTAASTQAFRDISEPLHLLFLFLGSPFPPHKPKEFKLTPLNSQMFGFSPPQRQQPYNFSQSYSPSH